LLARLSSDLQALLDVHGRIVWANPAFERATGCAAADACGQTLAALLGDTSAAWAAVSAKLTAGQPVERTELSWRHPSGRFRWGALTAQPLAGDGAGAALSLQDLSDRSVGVMVDDTRLYELAQSFNDTSEQLRLAVDLGNIAIWRQDLRSNRFHYNYRAFQVLDIPPRPEGLSIDEVRALIHPDDLPSVMAAASTALDSDVPVDMQARYRRSDGSWRHVLTRRVLRRDALGKPIEFVGVALDVTEQVEKSRSASELSQQLEIATHSAGLGIFSRDPDTERGEWNAEMFRIMGRDPALGVPSREDWIETIIHPDDRPMMRRVRESLLESSHGHSEEQYRVVRPDGEVRWVLNRARRVMDSGRPKVYGISIDVTDRVRTESALRSANERVALTARSVGMGTWEWDPVTGESSWDDAMYRLRGREATGKAPSNEGRREMAHPDDRDFVDAVLRDAVAEERSAAYEFRVVWPDGTVRWLASRSLPVPGADGQSLRYIGINWDITERVNAENERHERLAAQRESEAKSQFLARMSHELRTPLNAVLGFAQLLQLDDGRSTPAERRNRVDHIRTAGEHLLSLINDVLDLSSLETGEVRLAMQPVHLDDLVGEVLPLVTPLATGFGVTLLVGSVDGVAWGDRTRLRQVLINLLTNAIKYNRRGGEAHVGSTSANGRVTLRVRDTGRGLSAEQRGHLFEPFNRLGIEPEGIEGTGIGLAIVKALVDRMDGTIAIHSEPGVGTLFEIALPQCDGVAPTEWRAPAAPVPVSHIEHSGRLLYIEDNPINVMVVEQLVTSRSGLSIVSELNGLAGVERARALLPDLILVDMQLPDIDGFEVLRRLRAQPETAATPCVVLSANAMPEDISRALEAGFADYWTKPIDFNRFLSSLDTLLKRAPA
jgi:PAS domain S-box-containing protein